MSTDMLEDILDRSQSRPSINKIEARYKICNRIKQGQAKWNGLLLSTLNMGKSWQKGVKAVFNDMLQDLPILGESGSEFSYLIP